MSAEERLLEAVAQEEGVETGMAGRLARRHQALERRNRPAIDRFLGGGQRAYQVGIVPRYYGELLTWALQHYMNSEGWQVARTIGYQGREPVYIDVNTDHEQRENLLRNGQMLVRRGESRLVVTVDINLQWRNSVLVEGPARKGGEVIRFVQGVLAMAREQNFYRGKKIEFAGRLRFLDLGGRSWDSIILDEKTKNDIRANTVAFLTRRGLWDKYGIPPRRGILLAGEPGSGKTLVCKALMAEADGVTCIATSAYALGEEDYVVDLYELAQDLSPSLVFIEDIDLIGRDREEFGYQNGPALMALLAVLDGIEERREIVTVATTNSIEILDRALSQRPSRFDRVIRLPRPSLEQRRELVRRLCQRIPLSQAAQDSIARRTEGCTPAQVQEIVYSLAIEHAEEMSWSPGSSFTVEDIDSLIARINRRRPLGFSAFNNHNSDKTPH